MAGFFDNLIAPFTTNAQDAARNSQIAGINAGLGQYGGFADNARASLISNANTSNNAILGGVNAGNEQLSNNYGAGLASLTGNYGQGSQMLGENYAKGIAGLTSAYGSALQPSQYNFQQGQAGTTALGNALGLNGPSGNAAATQAFWNNPGIKSQLDIGSENVLRQQARTGGTASGATQTALQGLGQQVASQGWNNYVSQLQPYLNYSQGAASNIGNLYSGYGNAQAGQYANLGQGQAGLYQGLGNQLAGQYGQLGQGLNQNAMQGGQLTAGIYSGLGTGLANSYTNQGQAAYGANTSIGNANANADLASLTAGNNIWNTAVGVAGAATGAPGATGSAIGKLGTGLYNMFGGSSGSNTGQPSVGPFPQYSDIRVKDDVRPIARLADGLNVYSFRYKGSPRTEIGLIAQEVEKVVPDAVMEIGGIKAVDYKRATDYASGLMRLAA